MSWGVFIAALVVCVWSLRLVWDVGWLPGICLAVGMFLVWGGLNVFNRQLIQPLRMVVEQIDTMGQSKCWARLVDIRQPDLQSLVVGFNRLVDQLDSQQRHLKDQIIDLQRLNEELDKLANVKDDFLQTINHQFRTPMTAVIEAIGILEDPRAGSLMAEQQSYLAILKENAARLKELMEEMLDLSMVKSGNRMLSRSADDLRPLLQQSCARWQSQAEDRMIFLEAAALPAVYMDAKAIEEVLHHLLRNALRHAPAASQVKVRAAIDEDRVAVSIHNEGKSLTSEQIKRLFQPFVHLHTPDSPGSQGSGLGLAFCRQVVERHGGSIAVQSEASSGTTVTITLPQASAAFLLADSCQSAKEEADTDGAFGLCVVAAQNGSEAGSPLRQSLIEAEKLLRSNTHRGDRFVKWDDETLVIVAVCDETGLSMMRQRLQKVLEKASLPLGIAIASFPKDGDEPQQLVEKAREQLRRTQSWLAKPAS